MKARATCRPSPSSGPRRLRSTRRCYSARAARASDRSRRAAIAPGLGWGHPARGAPGRVACARPRALMLGPAQADSGASSRTRTGREGGVAARFLAPGVTKNGPGNTCTYVYDGLGRMTRQVCDLRVGGTGAGAIDTSNPRNLRGSAVRPCVPALGPRSDAGLWGRRGLHRLRPSARGAGVSRWTGGVAVQLAEPAP